MNTGALLRISRAVAGLLVLVLLFFLVNKWWGEYRDTKTRPGTETTATPPGEDTTGSVEPTASNTSNTRAVIQVLKDGVNFRTEPDGEAQVLRGLKKGEKLVLLKERDEWYECEDGSGMKGWLSAKPSNSKLVQ